MPFALPILFALLALFSFYLVRMLSPTKPVRQTLAEGRRLYLRGQLDEASLVFDLLARQRDLQAPERAPAFLWLGMTLELQGRPDDARKVYLRYLTDYTPEGGGDPVLLEAIQSQMRGLLEPKSTGESESEPASEVKVVTLPTAQDEALTLRGAKRLIEEGKFAEAQDTLNRLIVGRPSEAPGRESALYLLGLCYEGRGQAGKARHVYKRYMDQYAARPNLRQPTTRVRASVEARLRELETAQPPTPWDTIKSEFRRLTGVGTPAPPPAVEETAERAPQTDEERARDQRYLDRGLRVGDYILAEKLGDGGFGEVYRALRPVAIKFARNPEQVEHLKRFGVIQSQVESPRIVKPLEVNLDADPPYVVMEFVDGPTLRDLMSAKGPLRPREALPVLLDVARALADAHRGGVLHLDLKPENVLLDEGGNVKLTDFELGRVQGEAQQLRLSLSFRSQEDGPAGTLVYMSPEQRAGKQPDARSDVFTFGVLLFEALTGTLPEPGDAPSDFVARLPEGVDEIFKRCFARHERRYADAPALLADLERSTREAGEPLDLKQVLARIPRRKVDEEAVPRALALRGPEPPQAAPEVPAEAEIEPTPAETSPEPAAEGSSQPEASPEPASEAESQPAASPEPESERLTRPPIDDLLHPAPPAPARPRETEPERA